MLQLISLCRLVHGAWLAWSSYLTLLALGFSMDGILRCGYSFYAFIFTGSWIFTGRYNLGHLTLPYWVLCFNSFYFNKMRISLPTIPVSFHLGYHLFCFQTMLGLVQHVESTSECLALASLMQVLHSFCIILNNLFADQWKTDLANVVIWYYL